MRFFVYLGNLFSACDQNEANVNLDYHSVALFFFNQPEVVLSVLRNVADFDLNLCCTDSLQELCLCFTEIHQYWWNRMVETGRRTTTLVHLGPPNISVCGAGRPRSILLEELLENLRKSRQLLGNKTLQNPSILFNEQLLLNLIRPFLIAIHAAIYVLEESGNFQQNPHRRSLLLLFEWLTCDVASPLAFIVILSFLRLKSLLSGCH